MTSVANSSAEITGKNRRVVVITGGTDGIGRALAQILLKRGDHVVVIGRTQEKGRQFLEAAKKTSGEATFIQADLTSIEANQVVIAAQLKAFPVIDALVLCARYIRTTRAVTVDGLEDNFALYYLSRYLFSYGLQPALERAKHPTIVNVAGPGEALSLINWHDLQLVKNYGGMAAMLQAGKLNDLLGVSFAARFSNGLIRYILFHPDATSTGFAGEYDEQFQLFLESAKRTSKPAAEAAKPIVRLLDSPPSETLTAFMLNRQLAVQNERFDKKAAQRLDALTVELMQNQTKS